LSTYLEVVHDLVDGAAALPNDHGVDARIYLDLLLHHGLELVHNLGFKSAGENCAIFPVL
jgi:hypothetical protein